jgi:polyisoprenoid-binding protein YceI
MFGLALACVATTARAEWVLDNDTSRLSFVSTKAGSVAEVHRFTSLRGGIDHRGNVAVAIFLQSVDTLIPIRDERMRELLFETATFPAANLTAVIDPAVVAALTPGAVKQLTVNAELRIHGQVVPVVIDLVAANVGGDRLLVTSREPVIVNAAQLGLADGIERLRAVAQLPSISPAVPVTFVLQFSERL